ncbi:MAG: ABC transporter permease [Brevinematales bacterium]|nr:ABC transporter permease [Brevinematales bacterium]
MAFQMKLTSFVASFNRTLAIAEKEWIQIRRDVRSLVMALVIPIFLLFIFAYGLSLDIKNIKVAIMDHDRSFLSRELVSKLQGSSYFIIEKYLLSEQEGEEALESGSVKLVLVIPGGFQSSFLSGKPVHLQLLVDGSESTTATVASGYVQAIVYEYALSYREIALKRMGLHISLPLNIESRVLYNPELASKNFIIPGIIVIVMAILSAVITSLTIAREWERNTIETLLTTPLTKYEFFFGKLLPYLFIALFDLMSTVGIGHFFFHVPIKGSFTELYLLALLFLIGSSSLGMLLSTITRSQILSIQISFILTYLPTFILSGYIFPILNMPLLIQAISYLVPARYLISIIKGIALKGVGASLLVTQILFLAVFALLLSVVTLSKIRMSLEDE